MEQEHLPLSMTPPPAFRQRSRGRRCRRRSCAARTVTRVSTFEPDPMRGGNPSDTVLAHSSAFDFSDALRKQRQREPMNGVRSVRTTSSRVTLVCVRIDGDRLNASRALLYTVIVIIASYYSKRSSLRNQPLETQRWIRLRIVRN